MSQTPPPVPPSSVPPPALWNPNAAANWSLLFTPAFGAYLHARNAEALGRTDEARANRIWFYLSLGWLVAVLAGTFVPAIGDGWYHAISIGMLLGWYFSLGREQARYVKETWQGSYPRKPWGCPLLVGFGGLAAFLGLLFVLLLIAYRLGIIEL